jgi:hypothetical protein
MFWCIMGRKTKDLEEFRVAMDDWVKLLNQRLVHVESSAIQTTENADNIQHNYELVQSLVEEMALLRQEVETLKLIQVAALKHQGLLEKLL